MPEFPLGSEAYVHVEYFHVTHPSKKLTDKMAGPFELITHPGFHSYTLHLSKNMHLEHPVFHVAMLEPAVPNTIPGHIQSLPPPESIDDKEHYKINAIHDSAIVCCYQIPLHYSVEWKAYKETSEGLE